MTLRTIVLAVALASGPALAGPASAISLSIVPHIGSPTTFTQGQAGREVTFDFNFSSIAMQTDVVNFHDVFLAFDTSFLTYKSISFTDRIVSAPDDSNQGILVGAPSGNYLAPPGSPGWTYIGTDFGPGSLRIFQNSDANPLSSLFAGQEGGFTAFSITFDVITAQLGTSAIVMIDDRSYKEFQPGPTPPANNQYDYKANNVPGYPALYVQNSITIQAEAPLPAPWALMGLGLAIMGLGRRRIPAA